MTTTSELSSRNDLAASRLRVPVTGSTTHPCMRKCCKQQIPPMQVYGMIGSPHIPLHGACRTAPGHLSCRLCRLRTPADHHDTTFSRHTKASRASSSHQHASCCITCASHMQICVLSTVTSLWCYTGPRQAVVNHSAATCCLGGNPVTGTHLRRGQCGQWLYISWHLHTSTKSRCITQSRATGCRGCSKQPTTRAAWVSAQKAVMNIHPSL